LTLSAYFFTLLVNLHSMGAIPKLIFKAGRFAQYYGMPDGNVYMIYSLSYKTSAGQSGLKFVIARLKEFSYEYENETLYELLKGERKPALQFMVVDKCNQKIQVIKSSKTVRSYTEAEILLSQLVNHHP
jgi:hypothetical protein